MQRLDPTAAAALYPSFRGDDLAFGLLEPDAGVLRAQRAVRALAGRAVAHGAHLVRARARPDGADVLLEDSTRLRGDVVVWACGGWLAPLFGELVSLATTRQEVLFLEGGPGWDRAPAWVDYDRAMYGTGDVDALGFKAAYDAEGPSLRPDEELTDTATTEPRLLQSRRSERPCRLANLRLGRRRVRELLVGTERWTLRVVSGLESEGVDVPGPVHGPVVVHPGRRAVPPGPAFEEQHLLPGGRERDELTEQVARASPRTPTPRRRRAGAWSPRATRRRRPAELARGPGARREPQPVRQARAPPAALATPPRRARAGQRPGRRRESSGRARRRRSDRDAAQGCPPPSASAATGLPSHPPDGRTTTRRRR